MIFKPNLLGKITFLLICCLEYIFIVIPLTKLLLTHYIIIDLIIWIGIMIGCAALTVELMFKFLKLYE